MDPRRKTPVAHRDETIKIRLSRAQLARWQAVAGPRGLSAWLRQLADLAARSGANPAELRAELVQLRADLSRGVGNDINQLARALNTDLKAGRRPDAAAHEQALARMAEDVERLKALITEALETLLRGRT